MNRRWGLVVAGVILALGSQPSSAAKSPDRASGETREVANSQVYVDARGDSVGGSVDVTNVRVSNDDDGNVTFELTFANRTDLLDSDFIAIDLDTDRQSSTGCTLGSTLIGIDRVLMFRGHTEPVLDSAGQVGRISSGCTLSPPDQSQLDLVKSSFDSRSSTLSVEINRRHIGNPTSFMFLIVGSIDSGEPFAPIGLGDWDIAPNRFSWAYDIRVSPTKPRPTRDRTPPRVKALASSGTRGGTATLRYTVVENSGKAREDITVLDGRRVVTTTRTKLGTRKATAIQTRSWRVPPNVGGRLQFCVVARDAAGNRSAKSCAALRIR